MNKVAKAVGAFVLTAGLIIAPMSAYATETVPAVSEECVPQDAYDETIIVTPEVPKVDAIPAIPEVLEVSHFEYQRYSWTGGPLEIAPTELPPSANWQANTTNYEGAGHGTDPVNIAFQMDDPYKGNGDWFFWTKTKVIDQAYIPGVPEVPEVPAIPAVTKVVHHDAVTCEQPPVDHNECESGLSTHSTNLVNLWGNVDTRSSGHYEYVENGLHVWTTDNTSQAKVSLGQVISFPLHDTGVLGIDWTGSTPAPGLNLFINFGADGNGTLVYESVYGQDLWLTNGSSAVVKANAPVNGGGNGSQWHGTIDQWLSVYPDATVTGIAFSLGSGVLGDGVINSITVGCGVHTFDYVAQAAEPEALVEARSVVSEPDCDTHLVTTVNSTRTTGPASYDAQTNVWTRGAFLDWVQTNIETRATTAEECPEPEVTPTPTPSTEPTPIVTETPVAVEHLAATGNDATLTFGLVISGIVLALAGVFAILFPMVRPRKYGPIRK